MLLLLWVPGCTTPVSGPTPAVRHPPGTMSFDSCHDGKVDLEFGVGRYWHAERARDYSVTWTVAGSHYTLQGTFPASQQFESNWKGPFVFPYAANYTVDASSQGRHTLGGGKVVCQNGPTLTADLEPDGNWTFETFAPVP